MTDTATQAKPQISELGQLVVLRKTEIANLASEFQRTLPASIPADKFVRTVQTAIQMNPDIATCDKASVINACMKAASDGLILDGREAALVVYNTKVSKKNEPDKWAKKAQYLPMVAGIIKRVRNSGEVSRFNAFVVYEGDKFNVRYGLEMSLEHEPNFDNPGKAIGAYAIARFRDGLDDFEYMTVQQIEAIRSRSKSPNFGPWKTDWSEQARKTVMRRLSKRLPMDSDLRNVVQRIDEMYDLDSQQPTAEVIDMETGEITEKPVAKPRAKKQGVAAEKLANATQQTPPAEEKAGDPPPFLQRKQNPAENASNEAATKDQQVADAEYEEVPSGEEPPADDDDVYV
jgi:phage RecT family recombinase